MMKELKPTNLFAVEVAEWVNNFKFYKYAQSGIWLGDAEPIGLNAWKCFISMKEEYSIVGEVTKDKIGFDVEPYVFKSNIRKYKDFTYKDKDLDEIGLFNALLQMSLKTKEESFYSLLAANGIYFENPIDELIPEEYYEYHQVSFDEEEQSFNLELYNSDLAKWQSFEDKLIKGKILIIEKIK